MVDLLAILIFLLIVGVYELASYRYNGRVDKAAQAAIQKSDDLARLHSYHLRRHKKLRT